MVCREFRVVGTGEKISVLLTLASTELTVGSTGVNMELSAVGERVFAAESIIKRRIRKVGVRCNMHFSSQSAEYNAPPPHSNTTVALQANEVISVCF